MGSTYPRRDALYYRDSVLEEMSADDRQLLGATDASWPKWRHEKGIPRKRALVLLELVPFGLHSIMLSVSA
jgi:hypothetical protein